MCTLRAASSKVKTKPQEQLLQEWVGGIVDNVGDPPRPLGPLYHHCASLQLPCAFALNGQHLQPLFRRLPSVY